MKFAADSNRPGRQDRFVAIYSLESILAVEGPSDANWGWPHTVAQSWIDSAKYGELNDESRKVEGQMSQGQELILAMYAGFGGIVLLTGYVYKEIRDRKRQRKQPQ